MADWRADPGSGVLDRELRRNAMYGHAHDSSTPRGDRLDRTVPGAVLASAPRTPTPARSQGWSKSVRVVRVELKWSILLTADIRFLSNHRPLGDGGRSLSFYDDT